MYTNDTQKGGVAIDRKLHTIIGAIIDGTRYKLYTIKKGCSYSADLQFSDTIKVVLMLIK